MLITKSVKYYSKKISVDDLSENSTKRVRVKCPNCGEVRETYYSSYCRSESDMCQKCTVREKSSKTLEPGKKYNKLEVIKPAKEIGKSVCLCECGNKTIVDNWNIKSGHTKSCGCLKRSNFENTKKVKGENHGMWKGGSSSERERIMQSNKYKEWRRKVFERDNYTCQKCGQIGDELNAHHIKPFSEYDDTRFELDNGITLCKECHTKFHNEYGRNDNNQKQIERFITDG